MGQREGLREALRELKRLIREDPATRARFDRDGDGEISGHEWELAVAEVRAKLRREPDPAAAGRATYEGLRAPAPSARTGPAAGEGLAACSEVIVQQQVEMGEVLAGYETANRYLLKDAASGRQIGGVDENRGGLAGFFVRQWLGSGRPLRITMGEDHVPFAAEGERPFSILGDLSPPEMLVSGPQGAVGTIKRTWPILVRRRYRITVADSPNLRLEVDGTPFKPWTFPVKLGGREVACIRKRWSGFGKETFTDADTFRVTYEDPSLTIGAKRMILVAAIVVDFDFFESSSD